MQLLPTPVADHSRGMPSEGTDYQSLPNAVVALLPTPAVNDMGAAYTPGERDAWTDKMRAKFGNGNGHGKSLNVEVQRLIPTPSVADSAGGHERRGGARGDELLLKGMAKAGQLDRWGEYGPAIRRQEATFGRTAPGPVKLISKGKHKGSPKLSDEFDEWLMGLPAGWITDVPGITWNETLKACGNGVVPQQCVAGLVYLRHLAGAS